MVACLNPTIIEWPSNWPKLRRSKITQPNHDPHRPNAGECFVLILLLDSRNFLSLCILSLSRKAAEVLLLCALCAFASYSHRIGYFFATHSELISVICGRKLLPADSADLRRFKTLSRKVCK